MGLVIALVVLIASVAYARGGYDPRGMLVFELGAAGLFLWAIAETVLGTSEPERARNREIARAFKRLSFWSRHPGLGRLIGKRAGIEIEIEVVRPGQQPVSTEAAREHFFLAGFSFPRTGLGWPLVLCTLWILASVAPLGEHWLGAFSPKAHELRSEAAALSPSPSPSPSPSAQRGFPASLTSFLTLRDLWIWIAMMAVFFAAVHISANPERTIALTRLLFAVGIALGAHGIGQWLLGLRELLGAHPAASALRATGPFGNRNHYALFVAMLLLTSLGWLGCRRAQLASQGRARARLRGEAGARLFLIGVGIVVLALGLIFSLSRGGISFALVSSSAYLLLARPRSEEKENGERGVIDVDVEPLASRRKRPRHARRSFARLYGALALAVVAVSFWVGLEPLVTRFQLVPEELEAEKGRTQVWRESLGAAEDFWLTGSGLGSFAHVFPLYRTFGGRIFYSWAHNDYLQLLIELGVPGFVLLLWLLGGIAAGAKRARQRLERHPSLLYLHAGYCAAGIAVALHSVVDFGLHMPANAALASLFAGVIVGMGAMKRIASTGKVRAPGSSFATGRPDG